MNLQERLRHKELATRAKACAEAAAELDRLQARVAELEADAERLDWLELDAKESRWSVEGPSGRFDSWLLIQKPYSQDLRNHVQAATLRAAIDTARKAKP